MRAILFLTLVAMATARLAPLLTVDDHIPGSYIVKLKAGSSVDATIKSITSVAGAPGELEIGHRYAKVFQGFSVRLTDRMLQKLRESDAVEYIEEDGVAFANQVASWGLDRIDQLALPLDDEYKAVLGDGAGVNVYVLDTGINSEHVDYAGRAFLAFDAYGETGEDCNGHGTHCAGTVAGSQYGVAKAANVHGVRVLDCYGSGTWSGIIAGCDYVAANAAFPAVASMSLGGGTSTLIDNAVQGMIDAGITVVVAAGNDASEACVKSPARVPDAITVGATNNEDARAVFSNYGECMDIFAPGVDIKSAWIGTPVSFRTSSGTSMACPHVAGAAAILLGNAPNLKPTIVKETLQTKAIAGVVTNPKENSPNLLLYMGAGSGGGYIPTPAPTPPPCINYFYESSGVITSPNYPGVYGNGVDCDYDIVGDNEGVVSISFTDFHLESSDDCYSDYLEIYDGTSESAPLIGKWCGLIPPGKFSGTGSSMRLRFHSDLSIVRPGFSASYVIT